MPWLQLHLPSTADLADEVEDILLELGAVAVTLSDGADQPLLEPPPGAMPLWNETVVTALFEQTTNQDLLLIALTDRLGRAPVSHRFETVDDQRWERAWMDDFHPMPFGERLWIVPSWAEPPAPDAVNLRLDPGLAFGTGTHETTALCLNWLDGADVAGKTVLDFGCGSGVLAIAALLLGAERAIATDIDPQALLATQANAELNGVADRLHCCLPEQLPPGDYDLVLANILAGPLVELAPLLLLHCRPGGAIVLSGILQDQVDSVVEAYRHSVALNPVTLRGEWARVDGTCKPVPNSAA